MTLLLSLLLGVSAFAPETWFHVIGGNASKEGAASVTASSVGARSCGQTRKPCPDGNENAAN